MKRILLIGVLLMAAGIICSADLYSANITVNVKDRLGTGIDGAQVALIFFSTTSANSEPDGTLSKMSTTTAGSTVINIDNSLEYVLVASKDDYYPTLREQFEAASPVIVRGSDGDRTVNVQLNTDTVFADANCTVKGEVIVYSTMVPTLVFGSVWAEGLEDDLAFGVVKVTDTVNGKASLEIQNVPNFMTANYWIGCFSTELGLKISTSVSVSGISTSTVSGSMDLTSSAAEVPEGVDTAAGSGDFLIIKGVVMDTNTVPIPGVEVSVNYSTEIAGEYHWGDFNAWTDQNGLYRIWSNYVPQNANFHFYARKQGYVGRNVDMYITQLQMQATFKRDFYGPSALANASGKITGILQIPGKGPVPSGDVWVWGEDSAWSVDGSTITTDFVRNPADGSGHASVKYDGTFEIDGLAPGNYYIDVETEFNSAGRFTFNMGGNGQFDQDWIAISTGASPSPDDDETANGHKTYMDDMRITVFTSSCSVYSSSGAAISTYTIVNIEPSLAVDSATITGNIILVTGTEIPADRPITLMVHEEWNSFEQNISTTDKHIALGGNTDLTINIEPARRWVELTHARVGADMVEHISEGNKQDYWVEWDIGGHSRIIWENPATWPSTATLTYISSVTYQYQYQPNADFQTISGTGPSFNYQLEVSKGKNYELEIRSMNYGLLWGAGTEDTIKNIDMSTTSLAGSSIKTLPDIKVAAAGQIKGIVRKPDGTIFKPVEKEFNQGTTSWYKVMLSMRVRAEGDTIKSDGETKIAEDGTFIIGGLLPGLYKLKTETEVWVEGGGDDKEDLERAEQAKITWAEGVASGYYVKASTSPTLAIIYLKEGINVIPLNTQANGLVSTANLTAATSYFYAYQIMFPESNDSDRGGIGALVLPKDTKLTAESLKSIIFNESDVGFGYDPSSDTWMVSGRVVPGEYDFYAGAKREYSPDFGIGDMNMIFTSVKKGVVIDETLVTGTTQYVTLPKMEFGNAELNGAITGKKLFTNDDLLTAQANFEEFIYVIPSVILYDNTTGQLAGYSMELPAPSQGAILPLLAAIESGNISILNQWVINNPMTYRMKFLKPGNYTAIFYSPNYPKVVKQITLTSGQVKTLNVDLDLENDTGELQIGATISAVFVSTNATPIAGVSVSMTGPAISNNYVSDENGLVTIENLEKGIYYFQIDADGYAKKAAKVEISEYRTYSKTITLVSGTEMMWGYVYSKYFPSPVVYEGATVVAFDTTATDDMLGLYTATSDSNGKYEITGLIKDHNYKVWLIVPGKLIYAVTHEAGGVLAGYNFLLKSLTPDFNVNYSVDSSSVVFKIEAIKSMSGAPTVLYKQGDLSSATWGVGGTALSVSTATAGSIWTCSIPVASLLAGTDYTLRVYGKDLELTEATVYNRFNLKYPNSRIKRLDEIIAQGGDVELDDSGADPSYIYIPVGAVDSSEGASQAVGTISAFDATGKVVGDVNICAIGGFASMLFSRESLVSEITDIVSDIYEIELENAQISKSLSINLAYDREKIGDDYSMINVRTYNESTGEWEIVEGVVSVDQVKGTVGVEVTHFSKYAVFYGIPQEQTGPEAYAGEVFRMYNFPNPFDLEPKTVVLKNPGSLTASQTVEGTVLKYYLPAAKTGGVKFYIYNIAGELVCTVDDGNRTGGYIYYCSWDGKNDDGDKCASGVYFVIAKVDNQTVTSSPLKIAIIK